jgi:hypothetical protein
VTEKGTELIHPKCTWNAKATGTGNTQIKEKSLILDGAFLSKIFRRGKEEGANPLFRELMAEFSQTSQDE